MKKVYIFVRACELRLLDATRLYHYLSCNDYEVVYRPEDADSIVFFTCAFSNIQSEGALNKVKEFKNKYDAELIIGGCLPDISPEKLGKIFNGKMISTKKIQQNPDSIDDLFSDIKIKFKDIDDANVPRPFLYGSNFADNLKRKKPIISFVKTFKKPNFVKNTYFKLKKYVIKNILVLPALLNRFLRNSSFYVVRISWGCPNNCSYCVIKKAVGSLKSKPLNKCLEEFKEGLNRGYTSFVINSDDTGSYGLDINSSFPELLDEITKLPGDFKITILDLNPRWVVKYIDKLEEIVKREKIQSMEIPIQSGSSRILKLMRRYSEIDKIKNAFLRLKKADPNLLLTTHQIIGFPTETKEDFDETLSFYKDIDLDEGYIFSFTCSKDADAEHIKPKISNEEISKRLKYAKKYLKKADFDVMNAAHMGALVFKKRI